VKYQSISVAAEQNYISQSSFSSSISKLEKELGHSLLRRNNTGIEPTEFGKLVLEKAEVMFQAQDEILEAARITSYANTISIHCIPGAYSRILPRAIHILQGENSNLKLSVTTEESRTIAKSVLSGYASLGIVVYGTFLNSFPNLKYTPLFQDEYLLYVGKNSPYWNFDEITFENACNHRYIAYKEEFQKENGGLTGLFHDKKQPNIVFRTDDIDFMKQMIASYDYAAFFPKFMAKDDFYLKNGWIKALPISDYDMTFEVGYLENKKFKLTFQERTVVDVLKSTVSSLMMQENDL
jgi:DNA-binding transcriptional LysR family regulator